MSDADIFEYILEKHKKFDTHMEQLRKDIDAAEAAARFPLTDKRNTYGYTQNEADFLKEKYKVLSSAKQYNMNVRIIKSKREDIKKPLVGPGAERDGRLEDNNKELFAAYIGAGSAGFKYVAKTLNEIFSLVNHVVSEMPPNKNFTLEIDESVRGGGSVELNPYESSSFMLEVKSRPPEASQKKARPKSLEELLSKITNKTTVSA